MKEVVDRFINRKKKSKAAEASRRRTEALRVELELKLKAGEITAHEFKETMRVHLEEEGYRQAAVHRSIMMILNRVGDGRISAAEGARRIAEIKETHQ